ncbi:hypothetical protein QZH41_004150, partial [Actinostola sp. cb2023]
SCAHYARDCTVTVNCADCHSDKHVTVLHPDGTSRETRASDQERAADTSRSAEPPVVTNRCTEVCGIKSGGTGKSCAKICLANIYVEGAPDKKIRAYITIDDQSNYSLARAKLFEQLSIEGTATAYTLRTCSGVKQTKGRLASSLMIESLDQRVKYRLPTLTECDEIPNNREEIPTPDVARAHSHLQQIADEIPELDECADILLLVGRDIPPLHKVHESRNGPRDAPWGQRLDLGWVVLGNTCLDGAHKPNQISPYKTQILHNGRPSLLEPCPNRFHVNHNASSDTQQDSQEDDPSFNGDTDDDGLARNVFVRTQHDNKPGTSTEDRRFLEMMQHGMTKDENGSWEAPLPFRHEVQELPSSRENAMKRLKSTRRSLDKKPTMKDQYFSFMKKIFEHGHAELVPEENLKSNKPCWFLWYKDNDPHGDIAEYRMKVHIFGNTSSPAVANYGLRKTAEIGEAEFGSDAKISVERNFYVDDGLQSSPDPQKVMEAFPSEDHANGLHELDFSKGPIPVQRSLGWDTPLPEEHKPAWKDWCNSLRYLEDLKLPRSYSNKSLETAARIELHTFCDASEMAIGAVSYLKVIEPDGKVQLAELIADELQVNPADLATRSVQASDLEDSTWHKGPKFLHNTDSAASTKEGEIAEIAADDPEVRLETSPMVKLSPVIDENGLLRIGGRLNEADLSNEERHPLILPSSHHVAALVVEHYHAKVKHQGRVFTHGLVRSSGYWIIGGKSYVGLDVFGPWQICARRTRGGLARSKRWAVLFTSLRGPVIRLRSDCEGYEWVFNPPHASHAGGAWERMIGVARRVLESILADVPPQHLTHEAPEILTPATLLTQKPQQLKPAAGDFSSADLYSKQWRRVQHLANIFWSRWRKEYLPTLQNDWPLARVVKAQPGRDGKVREVDLETAKGGSKKLYRRPVTGVILLKTEEQ